MCGNSLDFPERNIQAEVEIDDLRIILVSDGHNIKLRT